MENSVLNFLKKVTSWLLETELCCLYSLAFEFKFFLAQYWTCVFAYVHFRTLKKISYRLFCVFGFFFILYIESFTMANATIYQRNFQTAAVLCCLHECWHIFFMCVLLMFVLKNALVKVLADFSGCHYILFWVVYFIPILFLHPSLTCICTVETWV